jgi:EPS-associated MarR family transcriptional regulator
MSEEFTFQVVRLIDRDPEISQRQISNELGVSLGKVNYCLKALMGRGLIKARNFKSSDNKRAYLYVLTPAGIENKAKITVGFLHRKIEEFEQLKTEIKELQREVSNNGDSDSRAAGAGK